MDALTHYQAMADELANTPPYRTLDLTVEEVFDLWYILARRIDQCVDEIEEGKRVGLPTRWWESERVIARRLRDRLV
jgi:hypothetical protein